MKKETKSIILELARGAGLISLALLLPGSCDAIRHLKKTKIFGRKERYYVNSVIKRLVSEKLLIVGHDGFVTISEEGKGYLDKIEDDTGAILKPVNWDCKYRVIIFDIPEEKRRVRNVIRQQLINWGFVKLQNSVWVHVYECQHIVTLLKTRFHVTGDVVYMTVDSIEDDGWLKKEFNLN